MDEVEPWREADAIGSFAIAVQAIGERAKADPTYRKGNYFGEPLPWVLRAARRINKSHRPRYLCDFGGEIWERPPYRETWDRWWTRTGGIWG